MTMPVAKVRPLATRKIGVMQGRLLPKYLGRYQAHPVGYWADEFKIAATLGVDCIEFILDFNDVENNPLMSPSGCRQISDISAQTGVVVKTICADYFMEAPLHSTDNNIAKASQDVLNQLIENASQIGVTDIVIPLVDQSSLATQADQEKFVQQIQMFTSNAYSGQINLCLETDLRATEFKKLLEKINSDRVTVNYDIGNSAGLGFDPAEEFANYGDRITDLHIKDRSVGGSSVPLGEGDANFLEVFSGVVRHGYDGPFIMQAFRDEEGVEIFKRQLAWFRSKLEAIDEKFEL